MTVRGQRFEVKMENLGAVVGGWVVLEGFGFRPRGSVGSDRALWADIGTSHFDFRCLLMVVRCYLYRIH
jgi:hypothetical protein